MGETEHDIEYREELSVQDQIKDLEVYVAEQLGDEDNQTREGLCEIVTANVKKFFDVLLSIVGNEYHVFAQVHLSTILENKVVGQDWRASLAHINRKSVDFVLCDKTYISPKLAIELDDKSHERPDRQERDKEVERILEVAGLPLLRIENRGDYDTQELTEKIHHALGPSTQNYSMQNITNKFN